MKQRPLLTALALAMVAFVSCKDNGKTSIAVPKDAAVVIHINSNSLSSKLSWEEIKKTNWFKQLHNESKDSLAQKIMNDPETSGIDVKSDLTFFIKKQGQGGYGVFEGTVKDATAFEAFVRKANKEAATQKQGEWSFIQSNDKSLVFWNNSKFACIVDMPEFGRTPAMTSLGGATEPSRFPVDSLKKFAINTLNLESSNSLTKDDRFADLLKQNGDVHFWLNSGEMYSGMGGGILSMMKINTLLEGSATAMNLNFDEGKISMQTKQYYGKEMMELVKKYQPKPVSADVINRIPSQNVVGAFVMNYPPEAMKSFLQAMGFDGLVNGFLGKYNYSLDEFTSAYKGQMLFAATDLEMKQQTQTFQGTDYTSTTTKPDMKILFALSVNNKASFEKLIGIVTNQLNAAGNQQALSKVNFKVNNDWFAISSSPETVDQFLTGGNNHVPFADKISGHPFGLYVDIQKILKSSQPAVTQPSSLSVLEASMKLWQDVVMTGGEYKDGAVVADIAINMVDKKTNSLKQLNQYVEQLAALKKAQQDANASGVYAPPPGVDTTVVTQ